MNANAPHTIDAVSQKILANIESKQLTNDIYSLGVDKQKAIVGNEFGEKVIQSITELSPKLAKIVLEFPFGQIYQRTGLKDKDREIITVASLAASGLLPQLNVHQYASLNVGLTEPELEAINIQIAVLCGMPKGINAMKELKSAASKYNIDKNIHASLRSLPQALTPQEYYELGIKKLRELYGEKIGARVMNELYEISPDFALYTIQCLYGRVYGDDTLTLREREMVTIAALETCGNYYELENHVYAALNVGLTEEEIKETVLQMAVYAGFENTQRAMAVVTKAFAK